VIHSAGLPVLSGGAVAAADPNPTDRSPNMMLKRSGILVVSFLVASVARAQLMPRLHYHFNDGGAPIFAMNVGTLLPAASPMTGYNLTGAGANGTSCLIGIGGTTNEVTTPLALTQGNNSWTIGFAIKNAVAGGINMVCSENVTTGFRIFTGGAAGAGNVRLTGTSLPTIDVIGGAGDAGWVHVAFVHDTAANLVRAYLNGVLVSSTAAPSINLVSGNALRIGRLGTTCLLAGTLIDDFRYYDAVVPTYGIAQWSKAALDPAAEFDRLMISEVSAAHPVGIEITNHAPGPGGPLIQGWSVKWMTATTTILSDPINIFLGAGEIFVVMGNPGVEPLPPGTQVLNLFPGGLPAPTGDFTVALLNEYGDILDEVQVDSPTIGTPPFAGGRFRGGVAPPTSGALPSLERVWGLDSDSGRDWTARSVRTFGRENTNDGTRGTDPLAIPVVRINEIDDNPDYVELFAPAGTAADVSNWFLLVSPSPGTAQTKLLLPAGTTVPSNGYLVLGGAATPPAEIPGTITYLVLPGLSFGSQAWSCALYDTFGRVVDLVRATSSTGDNVHNFPRAPSHHSDFFGAAGRDIGGDSAVGRSSSSGDTNTGANLFPIFTRTMGAANSSTTQGGTGGWGATIDVRVNATWSGTGFQAIINAPSQSGATWNFLVSTVHSNGLGILLGLGSDALVNFPMFYNVPPFSGTLGFNGSGRIDFPSGTLPLGAINADFVFLLQNASGAILTRTLVLEFDT
jgi:hypothetical protein